MSIILVLSRFNMSSDATQRDFILFWNSLTVETKIIILHFLLEKDSPEKIFDKWKPLYWIKFIDMVLSEENQYLKCLGTKLNNNCSYGTDGTIKFSPEEFEKEYWSLTPDIRFSLVSYFGVNFYGYIGKGVYYERSELLLRLVKYANEIAQEKQESDKFAFWLEVGCVLDEFAAKFFRPSYYDNVKFLLDGMSVFNLGEELERHWEIITFIPTYDYGDIGGKYLDTVPYTDSLFRHIDEEILSRLPEQHLDRIFMRKDVTLYKERRVYVLERDEVNLHAAAHNFYIQDINLFFSDQQIHKFLVAEDNIALDECDINACLKFFRILAYALELDIVIYQVGLDILKSITNVREAWDNINNLLKKDKTGIFNALHLKRIIQNNQKNRINELDPQERFDNLLKLRAYLLAKKVVRNAKYPLTGDFKTLESLVNKTNLYETYKRFINFFSNECNSDFDERTIFGHILYHELADETYIDDEFLKLDIRLRNYEVETLKNIQNILSNTQNILSNTSFFLEIGQSVYKVGRGIIFLYLAYSIIKSLLQVLC